MSHEVGLSGVHQSDTGSNSCQCESEASQQKSQGTSRLAATCWLLADLCGGARSQGVVRVRPTELIRPKQINVWPCEG